MTIAAPSTAAPLLADLGPVAQLRAGRLPQRLVQLFIGLVLYGVSLAMMVRGDLGVAPWDVMHTGVARHLPLTVGQAIIVFGAVALLLWVPLREKPGLGTVLNVLLVGLACDATLALTEQPSAVGGRVALMLGGVLVCGLATSIYVGAQLGRGPRDGLMTGLNRRTGLSLRLVRTGIELTVLAIGLALGGALGVGTVVFALGIGPLAQVMMPWFLVELPQAELAGDLPEPSPKSFC